MADSAQRAHSSPTYFPAQEVSSLKKHRYWPLILCTPFGQSITLFLPSEAKTPQNIN